MYVLIIFRNYLANMQIVHFIHEQLSTSTLRWVSKWKSFTSEQRKKKGGLYTDEQSTELGEVRVKKTGKLHGRMEGRYCYFVWPLYLSTCLTCGGPTRSIKTPASLAIWINEAHNPPPTKRWQHTPVGERWGTVYQTFLSNICLP